jgi:hypothetical protein
MSTDPGPTQWEPGKLRSLLDVLEIEAKPFVNAVSALTALHTIIRESITIQRTGLDEPLGVASRREFRKELAVIEKAAEAFRRPSHKVRSGTFSGAFPGQLGEKPSNVSRPCSASSPMR